MGTALILRSCKADMSSHGGFVWPKSGPVEAPDWNPEPVCGRGLHGLLWGEGNWGLLCSDFDAQWLVVEVDDAPENLVKIDDQKVKFHRGNVVYAGEMSLAVTKVLCSGEAFQRAIREAGDNSSSGHSSTAASSGDYSKAASSGDCSKAASSGDYSTAASSGDCSKAASSGDYSKAASSGDYSTAASSGHSSTAASSGDCSKAASSGHSSKAASSGDSSKAASSGDSSTAAARGEKTIAMVAGIGGKAMAGKNGCFALAYLNKKDVPRIAVGYVGQKGIKADTWYEVANSTGKLRAAK